MVNQLTIIKVGGRVVEEQESLLRLLIDFSLIEGPKILVHGGGHSATTIAARLGIETKMVDGRRITDKDMLDVVTMVYAGLVNKNIVAHLQANNVNSLGMTGADLNIIKSNKRETKEIDYGFVGDIDNVNSTNLNNLLQQNVVPVIAPITHNGKGQLLNTNADTIASALAIAMAPFYKVTLIFCFEKKGVLADPGNDESVIKRITKNEFAQLKKEKIITQGMIPKLENAFEALSKGVYQVRITNTEGISPSEVQGTIITNI